MPRTCGTVACDSSTISRKSFGKKVEQRVGRARPAAGRSAGGCSSRCPGSSPPPAASRCRTACGRSAAALRAACPALRSSSSRSSSSCLIASTAPAMPLLGHHEVLGRVDEQLLLRGDHLAAGRVDDRQLLDLVAPELEPQGVLLVAGPDLDAVAADAELAAGELDVVALVLDIDQLAAASRRGRSSGPRAGGPSSPCNRPASPSRRCTRRWPR